MTPEMFAPLSDWELAKMRQRSFFRAVRVLNEMRGAERAGEQAIVPMLRSEYESEKATLDAYLAEEKRRRESAA